jgi:predicted nucleotidyltransferase
MDFSRPIEALIPGVRGQILTVVMGAGREMSTAQIARLADVSVAQASRVLGQLTELGVMSRRETPPSVQYQPVEGNDVVELLRGLTSLRERTISFAITTSDRITPAPVHLGIYGSVATRRARAESDIDVIVVRPAIADFSDDWTESLDGWRRSVSEFAGNQVQLLEVSEADWADRDLSEPLWSSIEREQIVLTPTRARAAR